MNRSLRLAAASMLGLLAAACSASPDAGTQASSDPSNGGATTLPAPNANGGTTNDQAQKIDSLVAGAGNINTTATPDAAPVQTGTLPDKTYDTSTTQVTCKETSYSLTKVPDKFVAVNPNADVMWPGSLVQGKSMESGLLDPIPVERAPGTIVLTIASGGSNAFSATMDKPSLSAAIQAQNDILSKYTGATPAKFSYEQSEIYSMQQLEVAVDANAHGASWDVAANLSFDESDSHSRYLIQFTQEYFTMAFQPPQGAHGMFAPSVTSDDLAPYVGAGNPPVYISGVTYGRIFYLLFESTASSKDLKAAVQASFSVGQAGGGGSVNVGYKDIVNNATVHAYGIGGNAQDAIAAATGGYKLGDTSSGLTTVDVIQKFLTSGGNFSSTSPGVPISYTIRYLADSSEVKLALTTDYTAKDCTTAAKGCDGVPGSTKVLDACGVCGGDGSSCRCGDYQYKIDASNGGQYAIFTLNATDSGKYQTFGDDDFGGWSGGCVHMWWSGLRFNCVGNSWQIDSSSVIGSNTGACSADKCSDSGVSCGTY